MSIWVIGGTGDSAKVAKAISAVITDYVITVTTPEAIKLYDSKCRVSVGKMNQVLMQQFCRQHHVKGIIDASHPFAVEVSQNAIAVAKSLNLPYLRFERATVAAEQSDLALKLNSFDDLVEGEYLLNQRVLLAVGCKALPLFKDWHSKATLFARILPKLDSLQIALDSGFTSDRIIALRPPFSAALEQALWQKWRISLVVTKASGTPSGQDIKQQVAQQLNIPLITIARPQIVYPLQTSQMSQVVEFCQQFGVRLSN